MQINWPIVAGLKDTLIVSCQADEGEPLDAPDHIKALALSAIAGGAGGLRLEGEKSIQALRPLTRLPIIGLTKTKGLSQTERLNQVYITATFADAKVLAEAGADIIAIDGTTRVRPKQTTLAQLIKDIHSRLNLPVLADVSTLAEAMAVQTLGADIISTTLCGYTQETVMLYEKGPALDLLDKMKSCIDVPLVLEGRVWHPHEVSAAFKLGAYAVVVGSAITRPKFITARFVSAIPAKNTAVN